MIDTHEAHASYTINVGTHYAPLKRIDIQGLVNACFASSPVRAV